MVRTSTGRLGDVEWSGRHQPDLAFPIVGLSLARFPPHQARPATAFVFEKGGWSGKGRRPVEGRKVLVDAGIRGTDIMIKLRIIINIDEVVVDVVVIVIGAAAVNVCGAVEPMIVSEGRTVEFVAGTRYPRTGNGFTSRT